MKKTASYFLGKTVLITGAGGGLGSALCQRLGSYGANIIALDLDQESLLDLEKQLEARKVKFKSLTCDITDQIACDRSVIEGIEHFGNLNILINNAGITHFSKFEDTLTATVQKVMNVNFFGAVNVTKAALPYIIRSKGDIISISSVAGFSPLFGRSGYAASKHAMEGFFSSLKSEIMDQGVNVLSVNPSFIASQNKALTNKRRNGGVARPGMAAQTAGIPLTSENVARTICQGIADRKSRLLIGKLAKQSYWVQKLFPRLFETLMIKKIKPEFD